MRFVELAFTVPATCAEEWAALLVEAGAGGVEERDATTLDRAPEGRITLVAWVAPEETEAFVARVEAEAATLPEAVVQRRDREEDEWRDAWKKHFGVRRVGRFAIVPSWEKHEGNELLLHLDPGRAFGTGGHASTRLCLELLSAERPPADRFLDVGCGSGVLTIACARLFPDASGVGIDVDPDAAEVSRENAERNGVGARLAFSATPLDELEGTFPLITANIQPEVLIPMAPSLVAHLRPGGRVILSGILVEAAPPVEAAYVAAGLRPVRAVDEEGWRALELEAPV